jgi:hypothetical protein
MLFDRVDDQEKPEYQDPKLKLGEIVIRDAEFCVQDEKEHMLYE